MASAHMSMSLESVSGFSLSKFGMAEAKNDASLTVVRISIINGRAPLCVTAADLLRVEAASNTHCSSVATFWSLMVA